jgi:predicted Zn-dependent protease
MGLCASLFALTAACAPVQAQQGTDNKQGTDTKAEKAKAPPVLTEDNEVRMGRDAAEANDKQVKLITDAATVERVNRIGQEIAAVANKIPITAMWGSSQLKQFNYTFKVVDDKDVNAYSLPGGFIYVNKGLLDMVRSDDELAGVLAHEISHAAHHHMVKLLKEQNKIDRAMLIPKLLAIGLLAAGKGNGEAASNLWLGTQLYTIAKVNSYGVEAEEDADHSGIMLLTHTHYNPVGLYSFMLRMAAYEKSHIYGDLGIFRTHPPGDERAESAKEVLEELNIPIHLSEVDPTLMLTVNPVKSKSGGPELAEIKMRDIVLCRVTAADGMTAEQRARQIAKRLNTLLDTNLQPFEIRANRDQTRVVVRGVTVLTDADAEAQNMSLITLAHNMSDAVTQISQNRQLATNP